MSCRVVSKKSLPRGARREFLENLAPGIFVKWCEGSQMASHVIVPLFFISFIHWMTEIKGFSVDGRRGSARSHRPPRVPSRVSQFVYWLNTRRPNLEQCDSFLTASRLPPYPCAWQLPSHWVRLQATIAHPCAPLRRTRMSS